MANSENGKNGNGERTLENRIKNLQVSISIAKADVKTFLAALPKLSGEERKAKITRIAQLEKIIETKTAELQPLLSQRPNKNKNRAKTQVSDDEIQKYALKKYNIQF